MGMERYTQIRVLGKGSFGSAWLVSLKADPSVKYVAKEVRLMGMKPAEKAAAKHEINLLQKLNHPNIVRYIDHFEHRGSLYIVMEYADGGDLYAKIKGRRGARFSENDVMSYFVQLCLSLFHMHSKHIMHRDLKSQNTFLMANGQVKLGDFGISTILQHTYELRKTVVGTPYYFSPELVQSKPYNNKSDIWALGVILYELATLNHAFTGRSMAELSKNILRGRYEPISSSYSRDMRDLVASMLQVDPAKRPHIQAIVSLPFVRKHIAAAQQKFSSNLGAQPISNSNEAAKKKPTPAAQKDSNDILIGVANNKQQQPQKKTDLDDLNKVNDDFNLTLEASTATVDGLDIGNGVVLGGGNAELRQQMEEELAHRMEKQNNFNNDYQNIQKKANNNNKQNNNKPNIHNPLNQIAAAANNNNKNNQNKNNNPHRIAQWAGANNNVQNNHGVLGGGIGGHVDRFRPKNNQNNGGGGVGGGIVHYPVNNGGGGGGGGFQNNNNPFGMNNELYQEYLKKQEELKRLYGIPDAAGGGGGGGGYPNAAAGNRYHTPVAAPNRRDNPYFYGAVAAQAAAGRNNNNNNNNNYWNNNNGRVQAKFAGMGAFDRY